MKISSRLFLIATAAAIIMLSVGALSWAVLENLRAIQDRVENLSAATARLRNDSNLGAQAYRVIADTVINQNFPESAKKWVDVNVEINDALAFATKLSTSPERLKATEAAKAAMVDIRKLYEGELLQVLKSNAPREEIKAIDDKIDETVDHFNEAYDKLIEPVSAESHALSEEFGKIQSNAGGWIIGAILLGAALLVALTLVVQRSLVSQLGMELHEAITFAQDISAGDLRDRQGFSDGDQGSLSSALFNMRVRLQTIVKDVRIGSQHVAEASVHLAQNNIDLSRRTGEQTAAIDTTASNTEELGANVKANADHAREASTLANQASTVAVSGGEVVQQVVESMKAINVSSARISDIIGLIDAIAFQTNILALNAAVEAARAGEQGRGFAVVASEVRSLAGRSAQAAKEIKQLITASVDEVGRGSALADQAGETMRLVVESIRRVSSAVGEISLATENQAGGLGAVSQSVAQIESSTQQNAALVDEIAESTEALRREAADLVQIVAVFKLDDGAEVSFQAPSLAPRAPMLLPHS